VVAYETHRLRPTQGQLALAMAVLKARHISLPSVGAVKRAILQATSVDAEGAAP
jgi:hypothetical protein